MKSAIWITVVLTAMYCGYQSGYAVGHDDGAVDQAFKAAPGHEAEIDRAITWAWHDGVEYEKRECK